MPRAVIALVLLALALAAGSTSAQQQQAPKEPERLFRSREPLNLTLIAPLQTLFKNRDTIEKKPQTGTLVIAGEGGTLDSVPVTLETRGHFRLKSSTCRFPPIKVIFDKELMKETVFKGQGSLKLSTHCQSRDRYEQNVLVEEAVYRIYNQLTPLSNLTRLARIRYVPTEDTTKAETRYAFFIEDHDEMAKRNNGVVMAVPGYALSDMDAAQLDLVCIFLYMVGNHDWSIYALHNMRVVQVEGYVFGYPVAYDFDFTGLVNASYAGPPPQLPIKTLRQRLYRGVCRDIEELLPTVERVVSTRDSVLAIIAGQPGIEPGTVKDATNYLLDFFDDLKKPEDFKRVMGYACRG